jgi:hypothetical protein
MSKFESMMGFTNKDAIIKSLGTIEGDVQQKVVDNLKKGGKDVKESLKSTLQDAPAKYEYSSPGSVPFSQTGETRDAIGARVLPLMLGEPVTLKIFVTKKGFPGRMLEWGTSKMAARPWFFSGIIKMFPFLGDQVAEALAEVIAKRNAKKNA